METLQSFLYDQDPNLSADSAEGLPSTTVDQSRGLAVETHRIRLPRFYTRETPVLADYERFRKFLEQIYSSEFLGSFLPPNFQLEPIVRDNEQIGGHRLLIKYSLAPNHSDLSQANFPVRALKPLAELLDSSARVARLSKEMVNTSLMIPDLTTPEGKLKLQFNPWDKHSSLYLTNPNLIEAQMRRILPNQQKHLLRQAVAGVLKETSGQGDPQDHKDVSRALLSFLQSYR